MSTAHCAPHPANAPRGGPQTEAGKAMSSQNALTYGLFATRDFIRPDEREIYDHFAQDLQTELAPVGVLELALADEIRRALWRLRRCSLIEESFSETLPNQTSDPMHYEEEARLQLSVDRARALSHRLLHKCTAELRKLQTERQTRNECSSAGATLSCLGLATFHTVSKNADAMHARAAQATLSAQKSSFCTSAQTPPDTVSPKPAGTTQPISKAA